MGCLFCRTERRARCDERRKRVGEWMTRWWGEGTGKCRKAGSSRLNCHLDNLRLIMNKI